MTRRKVLASFMSEADKSTFDAREKMFAILIVDRADNVKEVVGSGIEIGNGLGLVAAHVLERHLQLDGLHYDVMGNPKMRSFGDTRLLKSGKYETRDFSLVVVFPFDPEGVTQRPCLASSFSGVTDVGFLWFEVRGPSFKIPIDLRPPYVGDNVVAFGFPGGQVDNSCENQRTLLNGVCIEGKVTEVHFNGSGGSKGFARFDVDIETKGGMSGGPVFSKRNNRLLGLVSSNLDGDNHSVVCVFWPIILMKLISGESLQDLHHKGLLDIRDADCISDEGGTLKYKGYEPGGPSSPPRGMAESNDEERKLENGNNLLTPDPRT